MSRKLPVIENGWLREPDSPTPIALDSSAWFSWLADEQYCSFHMCHARGGFTARKERKQRGQRYWVAYRQVNKRLYKTYLGTSSSLTTARLCAAAEALAHTASNACASAKERADAP